MPEQTRGASPTGHDNWSGIARSYVYTSLFSLSIALFTWVLSSSSSLVSALIVSFCIGLSINTAFVLLFDRAKELMSPYLSVLPIAAIGLCVGLIAAGTLTAGEPMYFLTESYGTLIFGLFFGIVGYLVIGTRSRLQETQQELVQAQIEQERQEKLLMQTELRLLQAQIEPHFLFNTLTNIASLIRQDPDGAEEMLENLTKLLRASLDRTRTTESTLGEELLMVKAYLAIQETRMRGRLNYHVEHDPNLDALPLPPLIIQPLVENAVKYAIDPREDGGSVIIRTRSVEQSEGSFVEIEISDDGPGIDPSRQPGTGIKNVRDRLRSLLPGATLTLNQGASPGLQALIKIPAGAFVSANPTVPVKSNVQ